MFVAQGPDGAHEPAGEPVAIERLEDEITTLAGHLNAATARFLVLVGEYDRRGGWRAWGSKSCADWLSWRCGISPVTAREHLRVARALEELPLVRAEFAAGRFSYSQARALTRVATPEVEPDLVEMARHCTAAQLDRLTRGYRKAWEQMEEASDAHARRSLDWWEDRGMLVIQARLPVAEGEAVLEAVRATRDLLRDQETADTAPATSGRGDDSAEAPPERPAEAAAEHDSAEAPPDGSAHADDDSAEAPPRPPYAAKMADALVAMSERALRAGGSRVPGAERHQLVVHVDLETLVADAPGQCESRDGRAIAPEVARRLGCDGGLVSVSHRHGRPLSVGRRTRSIPAHIRRALEARDGCCRFPGCRQRRHLDGHHIQHWAHGGKTSEGNLLLLCRHHHTLIHEGGFAVRRPNNGRIAFFRPDGRRIREVPRRPGGNLDPATAHGHRAGTQIDHTTAVAGWTGDRLDLPLATHLLCETRMRR